MKKRISNIILILIFLVGLSVLLYPTVSDYVNKKNQSYAITEYNEEIEELTEEDFTRQFEEAMAYNQALLENPSAFYRPFLVEGYEETLRTPDTEVMSILYVPSIHIKFPIYHGTDEASIQRSIGHLEGSSLPIGGESSHCVLVGHRGLPSAKLFTDLDKMKIGDKFMLTTLGELMTYQVDQILIVEPEDSQELLIKPGMDYCTLLTCTPYGVNSHRLLVRGVRVENDETPVEIEDPTFVDSIVATVRVDYMMILVFSIAAVLFNMFLAVLILGRKNRGAKNEEKSKT